MKKVLSAFLAALMCILPLVTGVSAAVPEGNDVLYTIEDASIKKIDITEDSTVEVAIFIESTKALNSIALSNFDYSKGALEFVEFSDFTDEFKSLLVFDTMKPDSNRGAVTAAIRSTTFSTPMKICTATFKVKTTADVGEYDISCDVLTKNGNQILASELDVATIKVEGVNFTDLTFKGKTVTYNGEVQNVAVTGVPANATVAYTVDGKAFRGTKMAGTYEVTATVTAPGFNKWEETATLTINKKDLVLDANVPNKVYDGTATIENFANYVTLEGVVEGDNVSIDYSNLNLSYFASHAGTGTLVGNVGVRGGDLPNYNLIEAWKEATATITPKPITVEADDVTVKVGAPMPEFTYTADGLVEGDELKGITLSTRATNTNTVKKYDIIVKSDKNYDKNYQITTKNGIFEVVAKTVQQVNVPEAQNATYGDPDFNLGVTLGETVNASAVEYESLTPSVVSVDAEGNVTILGAGSAKIAVTKAGDADYADFSKTVTFTVAKKGLIVTAKDVTVMKTVGTIPAKADLEYDVEGLVNGDTKADVFTGTLTTTATNSNTVKEYPITQGTLKANANYVIDLFNKGTLYVVNKTKQDITVTSNAPSTITYGDEGFKIDIAYGETVTDAETVIKSDNEAVATVDAQGNVTIVGAGEATITVSKAGNDTIADFAEEIDIEVAKKPITIAAKNASKKVGAQDPVLSYDFDRSQLVGNDTISGNVTRVEGEEVGEYVIGPGTLSLTNTNNYDVNFISATFTIFDKTPQEISVTPAYSKTYGDDGFKLDVEYGETVTDAETTFVSNNEAVVTVDAEGNVTIVGAGTAKITVAREGNEDLANFSEVVRVNVAQRTIKVKANDIEVYVDQTPVLTFTYEGELVGDDDFEGELYVNNGNVGGRRYSIKIGSLTLGNNYDIDFEAGTLYVLKKLDQFAVSHKAIEAEYGKAGSEIGFAEAEKYNSEAEIVFASSNTDVATVDETGYVTFVGAGKTTITVTIPGNYKFNDYEHSYVLTIRPKPITVTADDLTKKIGTADPKLTYKTDVDLVEGDEFTGELTRKAGEELGTYEINQGTLALSDNYKLTFVKGTFTIVDKEVQNITFEGMPESVAYGDDSFVITVKSDKFADEDLVFVGCYSDNEEVLTIEKLEGSVNQFKITVVGAGYGGFNVEIEGNADVASIIAGLAFEVEAKETGIVSIDLDNKTVEFDSVFEADKEFVSVDFNKLTFVPENVEEGQTPANYVVTGFELTGDKSANYILTTESLLVPISEEIVLVNVSALAENGTVEGTGSYLAGSTVTLKAVPNKNYKFTGWFAGEEKVSADAEYTFIAEADVELTATFKKNSTGSISVGGSVTRIVYFEIDDKTTNKVIVDKGDKVERPKDPVLEGFVFGGWFTDKDFTEEYDFDKSVEASFTLYAKWTEVEKPDDGEDKPEEWKNPYADVDENDWYYEVVKAATMAGIMNGVSDDAFAPDMLVTRAMVVTMLYRAEENPVAINEVSFEDLEDNAYYTDAVAWANENGIVLGYSETEFAPNDNVTREQIAAIIFRYALYKGVEAIELSENLFFDDADKISEYAVAPMNWLVGKEIITGYEDGTIRPQGNATRAEVAAITARILAFFAQ